MDQPTARHLAHLLRGQAAQEGTGARIQRAESWVVVVDRWVMRDIPGEEGWIMDERVAQS